MLVTINGRFLDRPITGVERVGWELIRALDCLIQEQHSAIHGFRFRIARPRGGRAIDFINCIEEDFFGTSHGHLWEQVEFPLHTPRGIILNMCNFAPVITNRSVTIIHDAHVWLIPENFSRKFRAYYKFMLPLSFNRSIKWITVSQFSEHALQQFKVASRPADKIITASADHMLRIKSKEFNFSKIHPKKYVLVLGSHSVNKNFSLVRRIAPRLARQGISVAVAGGQNFSVFSQAQKSNCDQDGLVWLGRVDDEQLSALYSNALCFLFPSLFEGFGLPPVEAMQMGCPVIAANRSAIPEILGDAAILLDPNADDDWVNSIFELLSNSARRDKLIELGFKRVEMYSWKESAISLLGVLGSIKDA